MSGTEALVGVLLGLVAGGVGAWFLMRARLQDTEKNLGDCQADAQRLREESTHLIAERAAFEERARRVDELEADLDCLRAESTGLRENAKRLEGELNSERRSFEERKQELEKTIFQAEQKLADSFSALSSDALRKNNQAFLELAEETLKKHNQVSHSELEKRQQAIDSLLKPIQESLEKVDQRVVDMGKTEAALGQQVKELMDSQGKLQLEARNLANALKNPSQRGRWGEIQLRRIVELAGMIPYCDFREQQGSSTEDVSIRPDMIINLPESKRIVVDAKSVYSSYDMAMEAPDDQRKIEYLIGHSKQVREQIKSLSSKKYWEQFKDNSPELVVMFMPAEPMFSAALEHDPQLIEFGVENRVLITTPITLIALLRTIAHGWRQMKVQENALEISRAGRDLYDRISTFAEHMSKVGNNLDRAVSSFNNAVGSLETRVLPKARQFKELAASQDDPIKAVEPVERKARAVIAQEALPVMVEPALFDR